MSYSDVKYFAQKYQLNNKGLSWDEIKELYDLINEVEDFGFNCSSELSLYIRKNKLGYKYRHISGIVYMENESSSWKFKAGLPPKIYAIVCDILGLGNKGSRSWVTSYTTYSEMKSLRYDF